MENEGRGTGESPDAGDGRYRALAAATDGALLELDAGGEITAADAAALEVTGYDRDALVGRHVSTVVEDADLDALLRALLSGEREAASADATVRTATGEAVPCELRAGPEWVDGEFRGAVVVLDAADRREREVRDPPDAGVDEAFERVTDAVYALDDRWRITYANERAGDLIDYRGEGLEGRRIWDVSEWAADSELREEYERAMATQEPTSFELRFSDGWYEVTAYPSETGLSVYFRDVTERVERERRYRALAEHFPNGIVTLFDRDLEYTLAAGRAFEEIPVDPDDVEGRRFDEVWDEATVDALAPALEAALDGEERSVDLSYAGREWVVRAVPVTDEDGAVVAGVTMAQDVTEREAVRRRLATHNRTLQRLYDISADRDRSFDEKVQQVLALGCEYLDTGDAVLAETDPEADRFEVVAASGEDERFDPGRVAPLSETFCRRTVETGDIVAVADAGADPEWAADPAREAWDLDCYAGGTVSADGDCVGTVCFVDDEARATPFTEEERTFVELATQWIGYELERRRGRERLERYREYTDAKLDALDDVFYTLDDEGRLQWWNDALEEATGYGPEELAGKPAVGFFEGEDRERIVDGIAEAFETGSARVEAEFVADDGESIPYEFNASTLSDPDGNRVLTGIGRDVSERRERERELEQYRALTEAANDVIVTIDEHSVIHSINPAVEDVFGFDPEELVGDSLTRLMPEDLAPEHRRAVAEYIRTGERSVDWDYVEVPGQRADGSQISLAISFSEVERGGRRYFTGIVRDITERKARERTLEQQRERLAALNQLDAVVREVTDAAIEQSTREEIEAIVCERLAESPSYEFAWIGDADPASERVVPRAQAGPGVDEYLDRIEVSIDPEDPHSGGPAGQAYLTGAVQTVQDVRSDPAFEPWREAAGEFGFRSSAAVPIVHEGAVFGVLNVYADRPRAFAAEERAMIGHLGEIVGHAIAAVERKRAMMSDEVVELELRIRDAFAAFGVPPAEGTIAFDRVVPTGGDEYRMYGTAGEDAAETLAALADALDHWSSIEFLDEGAGLRFEVVATESPLVGTVAAHGGVVETARIEDGDFYVTVHLPRGADVREVVDAIDAEYPNVEPLARRSVARSDDSDRRATLALLDDLTDRQRTALETAYYAGFFEWPRDASGEELADQLDIAPATFSQHLRAAQRKLLATVFEELPASG